LQNASLVVQLLQPIQGCDGGLPDVMVSKITYVFISNTSYVMLEIKDIIKLENVPQGSSGKVIVLLLLQYGALGP